MFTRALTLFGIALLALSPALRAQKPQTVDEKVEEMRRQVVEGKMIRSHVRVTVRLKNGNRIKGVVKNGFLVERVDGLRFVAAEKDEAGAGLRLYYWNGRNNFVFLPFADVQQYKVNERLTTSQLAAIEVENREREESSRRDRENEAARAAAKQAVERARLRNVEGPAGAEPAPGGETDAEKAGNTEKSTESGRDTEPAKGEESKIDEKSAEVQALYKLLQAYPPSAGWNKAKRDEISRRLAVVGAKPSEAEQRFVDKFAEWERACKMFGVEQPAEAPAEDSRGRRRSRR